MEADTIHRSVVHATFTTERQFPAQASRVFAAFADPDLRRQWNSPSDDVIIRNEADDFRVGGRDLAVCVADGQDVARVETRYIDIVANERLLFSEAISDMERLMGASLVTVELISGEAGTRVAVTIQTTGLDGSGLDQGVVDGWTAALDRLGGLMAAG